MTKWIAAAAIAAMAATATAAEPEGVEVTKYLPEFQAQQAITTLEKGLAPAGELDSALKASTENIWKLVEEYRKAPSSELEDKIYNAVAECGDVIVEHISSLEMQRDRLRDELHDLNANVDRVTRNIGQYNAGMDGRIQDVVDEAKALKDELTKLARQLASHPEDTEKRKEFRERVMEMRALQFKVQLYQRNRAMYAKLAEQIGAVGGFFGQFEDRLDSVLDGLALQKRLIAMNLTVLRDKAKVVAWLRGGSGGQNGAVGLVRQLGELSASLQGFEKVMDVMVNLGGDFDGFAQMVPDMTDPNLQAMNAVSDGELDTLITKFASE